jgi:hypothetical protein
MALVVTPNSSRLTLTMNIGNDDEGRPIFRSRSYSGVKPAAADQDVYDVALVLEGLQQNAVEEVSRVDETGLAEDGL